VSLLAFVVLGLLAGFAAGKIAGDTGLEFVLDEVLGVCGAVLAGGFFGNFGPVSTGGPNLIGVFAAIGGALALLMTFHYLARSAR